MFKNIEDKKYVLVDLFDTVIFRRNHPYQVIELWADSIMNLFQLRMATKELFNIRLKIYSQISAEKEAVYSEIIKKIFDELCLRNAFIDEISFDIFLSACHYEELKFEIRSHFLNEKMVKYLKTQKNKGKKIVCVSDFYLSSEDLSYFLNKLGVLELYDVVYSSSDFSCNKRNGQLYKKVIEMLKCSPKECVMIGDNKRSDIVRAKENGIHTIFTPNYYQHTLNKLSSMKTPKQIRKSYLLKEIKRIKNKEIPFIEYTLLFYIFIDRLFRALKTDGINQVTFLAREGMFLKKLFDLYQEKTVPDSQKIKTSYIKISRRSISNLNNDLFRHPISNEISVKSFLKSIGITIEQYQSVMGEILSNTDEIIYNFKESKEYNLLLHSPLLEVYDEEHRKNDLVFTKYLEEVFDYSQEYIAVVDVGWKGSIQNGLHLYTNKPIKGYYIGVCDSIYKENNNFSLKGLLFYNNHQKSRYYDYFKINTQLYEQLLSAPHGGATFYSLDESGEVIINEVWEPVEKQLYFNSIQKFQETAYADFERILDDDLCLNNKDIEDKLLSNMVVKSSLFTTRESFAFLKELDKGFVWNFTNEVVGIKYNNKVKVNFHKLLSKPSEYLRYFVKLERILDEFHCRFLYRPISFVYNAYLHLLNRA